MDKWEYEITSYPIADVLEAADRESNVIACDAKGVCFHKDMPQANKAAFVKILNDMGKLGWELLETHYTNELHCIWKRKITYHQLEH